MSFFSNALNRAKRALSDEPRASSKTRLVVGFLLLAVVAFAIYLGGTSELWPWLLNLTLAVWLILVGAADLLYENRRTLAILLRLVSIPFAVSCFVLFVTLVLDIWS